MATNFTFAASDELFVYNRDFEQIASYRSPYLKHCHEISRYQEAPVSDIHRLRFRHRL